MSSCRQFPACRNVAGQVMHIARCRTVFKTVLHFAKEFLVMGSRIDRLQFDRLRPGPKLAPKASLFFSFVPQLFRKNGWEFYEKQATLLIVASLAMLLAILTAARSSRADIFQWEYINPADPSQGKRQSTTLAPD